MSVLDVQVKVEAGPEDVWAVVADPRNLTAWDRHIVSVSGVPQGGLRKGSTYTTEVRFMGARARVTTKIVEFDRPRYSKARLEGLIDATVESWIEPDGDGSTLRHHVVYRFRGGPIGDLAARAIGVLGANALLKRGAQAQKRQAEEAARAKR